MEELPGWQAPEPIPCCGPPVPHPCPPPPHRLLPARRPQAPRPPQPGDPAPRGRGWRRRWRRGNAQPVLRARARRRPLPAVRGGREAACAPPPRACPPTLVPVAPPPAPAPAASLFALLKLRLLAGRTLVFAGSLDTALRIRLVLERFSVPAAVLNAELPANSRRHIVAQVRLTCATSSSSGGGCSARVCAMAGRLPTLPLPLPPPCSSTAASSTCSLQRTRRLRGPRPLLLLVSSKERARRLQQQREEEAAGLLLRLTRMRTRMRRTPR